MTKSKLSERSILMLGYSIEWQYSPRGTNICKATKDGFKPLYATNLISLHKLVSEQN